jgi:hypothetical protein
LLPLKIYFGSPLYSSLQFIPLAKTDKGTPKVPPREGIAGETAIKLMHKKIGICSRYRVQTRKFAFMDKIRCDTSDN